MAHTPRCPRCPAARGHPSHPPLARQTTRTAGAPGALIDSWAAKNHFPYRRAPGTPSSTKDRHDAAKAASLRAAGAPRAVRPPAGRSAGSWCCHWRNRARAGPAGGRRGPRSQGRPLCGAQPLQPHLWHEEPVRESHQGAAGGGRRRHGRHARPEAAQRVLRRQGARCRAAALCSALRLSPAAARRRLRSTARCSVQQAAAPCRQRACSWVAPRAGHTAQHAAAPACLGESQKRRPPAAAPHAAGVQHNCVTPLSACASTRHALPVSQRPAACPPPPRS